MANFPGLASPPPSTWPPALWTTLVNTDNFPAAIRNLIPVMDFYQWLYRNVRDFAQILPHQPPVYRTPVYGLVDALTGGSKELVSYGTVGYDAVERKVLFAVNKNGGWIEQEARFDIGSVIPLVTQIISMIPWDTFAEIDGALGARDSSGKDIPGTAAMGAWLYDKTRAALNGRLQANLPALNRSAQPTPPRNSVYIPAGTYSFSAAQNIVCSFTINNDITLLPGRLSSVPYNFTPSSPGNTGLAPGLTVNPVFNDPRLDGTVIGILQNNAVAGTDAQQAPAKLIIGFGNSSANPVSFSLTGMRYGRPGGTVSYAIFRLDGSAITAVALNGGQSAQFLFVSADGSGNPVPVNDPTWTTEGTPNATWLTQNGAPAALPAGVTAYFTDSATFQGATITAQQGANSPATPGSGSLLLKNTASVFAQLIPRTADLVLHNIPVMDLSQFAYDAIMEMVEAISHHPPAYHRHVTSGGVYVQYRYYLYPPGGSRTANKFSTEMPGIQAIQGSTLEITAVFRGTGGTLMPNPSGTGPLEYTLISQNFYATALYGVTLTADTPGLTSFPLTQGMALEALPQFAAAGMAVQMTVQTYYYGSDEVPAQDAVLDGEGNVITPAVPYAPATPAWITANLTVQADASANASFPITPAHFSIMLRPVLATVTGSAFTPGPATLSVGATATANGLRLIITGIVDAGSLPAGANVGDDAGVCAVYSIDVTPDNPSTGITGITGMLGTYALFGSTYLVLGIPVLTAGDDYASNIWATGTFSGDLPANIIFSNKPLAVVEFAAGATPWPVKTLVRYKDGGPNLVGDTFSVAGPFNTQSFAQQYLFGRLRVKWQNTRQPPMEPVETYTDPSWTVFYTASPQKVPAGLVRVARVRYNAQRRAVTITSTSDGSTVEMKLKAAVWFVLHAVLMLPVQLI